MTLPNPEMSLQRQKELQARLDDILTESFLIHIFDIDDINDSPLDLEATISDEFVYDILHPSEEEIKKYEATEKLAFSPIEALKHYIKECDTKEDIILGFCIFLEKLFCTSNEIRIPNKAAWGLLMFMNCIGDIVDKIFIYIMDYLISHIEIVYPEDSTSFIANGSDFDLLIFEKIYGSLSKSEGFLEICSTKSKKKYEDFLEIKNIKR